jgi:hypothetical protein
VLGGGTRYPQPLRAHIASSEIKRTPLGISAGKLVIVVGIYCHDFPHQTKDAFPNQLHVTTHSLEQKLMVHSYKKKIHMLYEHDGSLPC